MEHKTPLRRIIRRKHLPQFVGLQLRRIDELIVEGKFPKPIKLTDGGIASGWLEDEIVQWQEDRIKARAKTAAE
jgi:prophage regulatory protein